MLVAKRYFPEIDTLRCIAVCSVIIFHARLGGMISQIGWMGVWLFFVISGFVITLTLISGDYDKLTFFQKMKTFWVRRSFRIIPLYYFVISLLFVISLVFGPKFAEDIPYLVTFTYNFYRIFGEPSGGGIVNHFWSLSVEEQFYFIFPTFAFLAVISRRALSITLWAVVITAPLVRIAVGAVALHYLRDERLAGDAVYQFSLAHFDAFAAGALLAFNLDRIRSSAALRRGIIGASIIAALLYATTLALLYQADMSPLGAAFYGFRANAFGPVEHALLYTTINLIFSAIIVVSITVGGAIKSALNLEPLKYMGRISFGLYVYHMPIRALYTWDELALLPPVHSVAGFSIYFSVVLAVSATSFHLLEQPILKSRGRFLAWASR